MTSKGSGQTARTRRLIWGFDGRTHHIVGNHVEAQMYWWTCWAKQYVGWVRYNAFNVYRRELAPGTVSLTGDRAQRDDSKHWAYSNDSWFQINSEYCISIEK